MREDRQRLDKWLWFARFARTRPAAARLVEEGHVRVNGARAAQAGAALKAGDILTLALAHATMVVRIVGLGTKRAAYPQARLLYEVLSGPDGAVPTLADDPGED